jgi:dolichol-phosphate mannosyltransferase
MNPELTGAIEVPPVPGKSTVLFTDDRGGTPSLGHLEAARVPTSRTQESFTNSGHGTNPDPLVSIVLATLNERENIPRLVDDLTNQRLPSFEIIVVDDGSTDGTRQYLSGLAARDPRIRLIFHEGEQTLTPAQCQGIEAVHGDLVIVMDSDLQHPAEVVPEIVDHLRAGAGLVIASRYRVGGSTGGRSIARSTVSRTAESVARLLLPAARCVTDPLSGFFGFRREAYFPLKRNQRGYKLLLFVMVMCQGWPVREVSYEFRPRKSGKSKITGSLRFVPYFLREVTAARRLETHIRGSPIARTGAPSRFQGTSGETETLDARSPTSSSHLASKVDLGR